MADRPFDLTLDPGMAYRIAELVREYDSEDMSAAADDWPVDDDPGDDARPDNEDLVEAAEAQTGTDPIETELRALIEGLNVDAQKDLLALMWVGRGEYSAKDWFRARRQARQTAHLHVAQYLEETPLASDYLIEALTQLGYPQSDYEAL